VHGDAIAGHDGGAGRAFCALSDLETVEDGPPVAPGPVPDVVALVAEDVEDVEADQRPGGGVAGSTVETGGEKLEIGPPVGGGDDHLAVQYDVAEAGEAFQFGQFGRPVVPAPGPQPGPPVADLHDKSPPVELWFEYPAVTRRRSRRGGEEHEAVRGGHAPTSVVDLWFACPGSDVGGGGGRIAAGLVGLPRRVGLLVRRGGGSRV
jgi:hypothetical protein